ncbi:MAG: Dihydroorotase [Chlamydiae bacterium]|nr:Dihydroorotase [Chlamydiota bacterium]
MIRFLNQSELKETYSSSKDIEIDAKHLTVIPALIDPHVHFRTPGENHKEDWAFASRAAIAGGVTTVFDMPNNAPPCISKSSLLEKKKLINEQLNLSQIPLRYHLFFGAEENHLDEIYKVHPEIIGIKIYLASTTGNLLIKDPHALERLFKISEELDVSLSFHAENEPLLKKQSSIHPYPKVEDHPTMRPREGAVMTTSHLIGLASKYRKSRIHILHVGTKEELPLIKQAKKEGLHVYAETTPNHLFLNSSDYSEHKTYMQMNPPIRDSEDQMALWEALKDGTIDWIGTDHAPHTRAEKEKPYPSSPSGIPGVETLLPLLLNAVHEKKISLKKVIELTHTNIVKIFKLNSNKDLVLVDLNLSREVKNEFLKTKCGWSPYNGWELRGWPVYTILKDQVYRCQNLENLSL